MSKTKQTKLAFDTKRKTTFTLEDVDIPDLKLDQLNITFIDNKDSKEYKEMIKWLQFMPTTIGLDIETRGLDPHQHELIMLQFGDLHRQFVIDARVVDTNEVIDYILMDDITVVGQNLKFEYKFLKHNYNKPLNKIQDTLIIEKCLFNGKYSSYSLKALAKRYLNYEADKEIRMRFLTIEDMPFTKDEIIYGALDVIMPLMILEKQTKFIKEYNQSSLIKLEHEMVKVLGDMEYKGLYFDQKKWLDLYNENLKKFKELQEPLDAFIIDNKLNKFISNQLDLFSDDIKIKLSWTSSTQVIDLFKDLNICPKAVSKTTKKLAYTVDSRVLKSSLNAENKNIIDAYKKLIKDYLKFKEYEQRVTTFGEEFLKYVNPVTNRLHSSYNQIISTGRMSSSAPNLQNIPSDPRYRQCFTAPKDHKIINADFSGQETVVLANKSLEPAMIKLINEGGDMHSFVTRNVFPEVSKLTDKEIKENHKEKRQISKAAGFAINYGGTGYTIAKNLGIPEKEGDKVYNAYFKAFPTLKKYFDKTIKETLKRGYILINEQSNRVAHSPYFKYLKSLGNTQSARRQKMIYKGKLSRLALNVPVQGTAGDITKSAAIKFRHWIYKNKLEDKVFITNIIHDEINVEAPVQLAKKVATALEDSMVKAGEIWCKTVPLKADAQIGDYWAH